jgi:predicted  nucleic acid-binding Zn-ribbon protein
MTRISMALTRTLVVGSLISLCSLTQLQAAVEIRTTSGDVIIADIVEETDTTLKLKRHVMIRHKPIESTITLQKLTITARKEVPSLVDQYKVRAAETPEEVLAQCVLARWCFERALVEQSLNHTQIAQKLDSSSPIVSKLYGDLGYVKDENGAWIGQEEYLTKTGKVSYGGTLMTKEEAEQAKLKLVQTGSIKTIEQQIRDAESSIKNAESKIAEYTAQRDEAKGGAAKAKSEAAGAKNQIEALTKRVEERSKQGQYDRTKQNQNNDQAALAEANATYKKSSSEQKKFEREQAAAEERLEKYKATFEKAKKELPDLKKKLEELTSKLAVEDPKGGEKKSDAGEKPDEKSPPMEKPKSRFGDL